MRGRISIRLAIHVVAAATACALTVGGSRADAARQKLVILGVEARDDGDARSRQRTAALARALTEGLRSRAAQAGSYELAAGAPKELLEIKLLSDCIDEAPNCMAAIGKDLGGEVVLFGHVERNKKDATYTVDLRSIVVASARPGALALKQSYSAGEATEEAMRKLAPHAFVADAAAAPALGTMHDTALIVEANVGEGTILVNGTPRGTLAPGKPTVIRGLAPGSTALAVESPGRQRAELVVDIREGQAARATVNLEPKAVPFAGNLAASERVPAARGGGTARVMFWTSLVATGAGVAAFTITGLKVRSIEDEQNEALTRFDLTANGVMFPGDACREARADGFREIIDICDRGKNMATVTNVLIGATAVAAVATAIFYWRGYLAPGRTTERTASRKSLRDSVTFSPEIYSTGAGFGAAIQF